MQLGIPLETSQIFFFSKSYFRTSCMNCPKLSPGIITEFPSWIFGKFLKIPFKKSFKKFALVSSVCSLWVSLENSAGIPSEILFGLHPEMCSIGNISGLLRQKILLFFFSFFFPRTFLKIPLGIPFKILRVFFAQNLLWIPFSKSLTFENFSRDSL